MRKIIIICEKKDIESCIIFIKKKYNMSFRQDLLKNFIYDKMAIYIRDSLSHSSTNYFLENKKAYLNFKIYDYKTIKRKIIFKKIIKM